MKFKFQFFAGFFIVFLFYSSCSKDSLRFEDIEYGNLNKDETIPYGDDVESVIIGKDGIATIKTSKGQVYKKSVLMDISKREGVLQTIADDSLSFPLTGVIKIPVIFHKEQESTAGISSSENPTPPAAWIYTYSILGPNYGTVTVSPTVQSVGIYIVRCTVFNIVCVGRMISWDATYLWTKNGDTSWSYSDHQTYVRYL